MDQDHLPDKGIRREWFRIIERRRVAIAQAGHLNQFPSPD